MIKVLTVVLLLCTFGLAQCCDDVAGNHPERSARCPRDQRSEV